MIVLGSHEKFAWGCFYLELPYAELESVRELSSVKAPRNKQTKLVIFLTESVSGAEITDKIRVVEIIEQIN
jgi:hypothetical protein